jgi:hypothetical protein
MEIQELVSYYLFEDTKRIEISFRLSSDSDDEIRNDIVDDTNDFFGFEDEEDDYYDEEFQSIDEEQLISFLNEYYIVNQDKLPKSEIL